MDMWDYGGDEEENPLDSWEEEDYYSNLDLLEGNESLLSSNTSLIQLLQYCVLPVLLQTLFRLLPLLCITFLVGELLQRGIKGRIGNILCAVSGAAIVGSLVNLQETLLFVFVIGGTYPLVLISARRRSPGIYFSFFLSGMIYLVFREYVPLFGSESWAQVRGIAMIGFMKTVSVAFELTHKEGINPPSPTEFFGYIFFPGTISFGPWVSFSEHSALLDRFVLNTDYGEWSLVAMSKILRVAAYLLLSTCFIHAFFTVFESPYFLLFRDAMMVRFSHYFICRLSETVYFLSGPRPPATFSGLSPPVVMPLEIEFPRSLVDVVVNWNLPMHRWLKQHVYNPLMMYMGKTKAGLITFLVSAMLHGLNFRLSAVLLSLAVYCYIEHSFRQMLADFLGCCVQARPCIRCDHKYRNQLPVQFINFGFHLLAIFNLAYLGVLLDNGDEPSRTEDGVTGIGQQLERWSQFNYSSHFLMFGILGLDFLFRAILQIIQYC